MNPEDIVCPECGVPAGQPCLRWDGTLRRSSHRGRRTRKAAKAGPVIIPDATAVRCPSWSCRARPGEPCLTTDGRTVHPHRQRWEAAILRHADGPDDPGPADDISPAPTTPLAAR